MGRVLAGAPQCTCRRKELMMTQYVSFGQWLRSRRKALDLTQSELAEQIGCAEETIRKLEGILQRGLPVNS